MQVAPLDRDGFVVVADAVPPTTRERLVAAVDAVYRAERRADRLADDGSLHLLGAVARDPAFVELLDLRATLPLVVGALGWNVHMYHSHLDVHPPAPAAPARPAVWRWHQDGGRQNVELETEPRPRLSVKVAFFLTDVGEPGRGNLLVVPGSHRRNALPGRETGVEPPDAVPILAAPGTAVVFDRRLWHARSDNRSDLTRKVVFLAYTYRWIRPRDPPPDLAILASCSPVRRQLLGAASGPDGHWLPTDEDVPLRPAAAPGQRQ